MGKKLYTVNDDGAIRFKMGHRAWGVDVPAYVYDIWMPLLGATAVGVYAAYCRLGYERKIWGQGIKELAEAMRLGDKTLAGINDMLAECGFIRIEIPQGQHRVMHWTTKITILEPPREIPVTLLEKYVICNDPIRYKTLVPWLVDDDARNRYPTITKIPNRQVTIRASGAQSSGNDAKNDPSDLNDPAHKKLSAGTSAADGQGNSAFTHFPATDGDDEEHAREQVVRKNLEQENALQSREKWTAFEKWLLTTLRKKSLTEQQRDYFSQIGFYVPAGSADTVQRPTVNEAWDKWPSFRQHVAEKIVPAMKTKNMFNIRGFNNWLNSPETWRIYMEWRDDYAEDIWSRVAKPQESGRLFEMPDGIKVWVAYSKDTNEAIREYFASKQN